MTTEEWVVRVVLATTAEVSEAELSKMSDVADEHDATVARRAGEAGVVVTMNADVSDDEDRTIGTAVDWALSLVCDVGGYDDATPVDVRFMTLDAYEAEALRPDIPPLASAADAAEILGVSRQRVHQLATSNPQFPHPVARVATGPLWTRRAIEWFDSVWERKAGRPAKLASVDGARAAEARLKTDPTKAVRGVVAAARARAVHEKRSASVAKHGRVGKWAAAARAVSRRQSS